MGKLVRDKIPNLIEKSGRIPVTKTLEGKEYRRQLFRKFGEEFREYRQAENILDKAEEMADILTVLKAILEHDGVFFDDVYKLAIKKNQEKGEFKEKIYLDKVEESE